MKLTPLEIRKHEFARSFRGYDAEEVDAFLNMVAQHWQTMSEEVRRMEDRLEEQTQRVNHYLKVEEALEHALENTRTLSREKLDLAEQEASQRTRSAEEEASRTLDDARSRAANTVREAEERTSRLTQEAERRLTELTQAGAAARSAAITELAGIDANRRQIIERFAQFLDAERDAVRRYDLSEPGPAVAAFGVALAGSHEGAADSPTVREGPTPAPAASNEGSEADRGEPAATGDAEENAGEADHFDEPAAEDRADEPAAEDQAPEPAPPTPAPETPAPAPEAPAPAAETATPEPETPAPAAEDPTPAPKDPEPAPETEAPAAETKAPAPKDPAPDSVLFEKLPSADDGFEEADLRVSARPTESAEPPAAEFGADDEIRKIRRILEDLDS
jgi:DivIVA domain-containing protein